MILKSGNIRILVTQERSKKNDREEENSIVELCSIEFPVQVMYHNSSSGMFPKMYLLAAYFDDPF